MVTMAEEVDRATEYVHFEFYIAAYDETSAVLWDSLFAAHRRGVQVRVLIDHIGSRKYPSYKRLVKMLNESGMQWKLTLPIKPWKLKWQRPDLRNHRKILVVDGQVAFSGSQNVIDRSYDTPENIKKGLRWKDLTFSCTGPIVEELNAVFVSDWYSETNQLLLAEINTNIPYIGDGMRAQVVPSGPGFETENNLRLINYMIYNAERRITICSPYFVPEETLLQALTNAAYSGIETTVIVCEKGDQFPTQHGATLLLRAATPGRRAHPSVSQPNRTAFQVHVRGRRPGIHRLLQYGPAFLLTQHGGFHLHHRPHHGHHAGGSHGRL